jgi:hypothetical protein
LCLDLSLAADARLKVYRRHRDATAGELESVAACVPDYPRGDAIRFYTALGGGPGPFTSKPPATSLTFRGTRRDRPSGVTLAFPIAEYSNDDAIASDRIRHCIVSHGLSPRSYEEGIRGFAVRPLAEGRGMHAHVTLRREHQAPVVTLYFASEAYRTNSSHGAVAKGVHDG